MGLVNSHKLFFSITLTLSLILHGLALAYLSVNQKQPNVREKVYLNVKLSKPNTVQPRHINMPNKQIIPTKKKPTIKKPVAHKPVTTDHRIQAKTRTVQKLATPLAVEPKTQPIQSSEVTSATTAASETDHRPLPEITKDSAENSRSPIKMPPQTPDYLNNPKPFYPLAAKRRGIKGRVILEVIVSASGAATQVLIKKSSGYKLLDRAASDTVASWRFIPASEDGENIEAIVEIPIRFELTQG